MAYAGTDSGLLTITKEGTPECRMKNAAHTQDLALRLRSNDEKRSYRRARVNGLVGGNPPYRMSKLRDAGRADACNVNWNTARMYLESGSGAFYDLFSEAPGYVAIETSHGSSDDEKRYFSTVMSDEADRILRRDLLWDFEMQLSQDEMVLHGRGPLMFEDPFMVIPKAFHDGDLRVPERTKADSAYWELACIDADYFPPEIYKFIANPEAAKLAGWDVEFTKEVISNAMDVRQPDNRMYDWEFYQQEIKHNSLSYYDDSKVCHLVHCFWKEFDGRVTHAIIEREATAQSDPKYLMLCVGRYANFAECVHPMYFDRGNGGFHHSVTGLGTKMYGAMEYENRLLCNLMDKAFAPKILFRPTSSDAKTKMELASFGDYGSLPAGWDAVQVPIQGFLTDGLAMWRASTELTRSNLSNYRQQVPMREQGNPATAREVALKASEQSSLSKPTYSRYYRQLDILYTEIVRRLCNLNSTDRRAVEFQERCEKRGVKRECFGRVESVQAIRVIGQGNPFMRQQAIAEVGSVVQRLPEDGQQAWLDDFVSSRCGAGGKERYNPTRAVKKLADDQTVEALQSVGTMKLGIPVPPTASQNPVIYSKVFLTAASQSVASLQKGADPMQIYAFLEIIGPAIRAQLSRFEKDPTRSQAFAILLKQWEQLSKIADGLKQQIAKQQEQKKAQAQKSQSTLSDEALKALKTKNAIQISREKLALAKEKHAASLQNQSATVRQQLAIADAQASSDIIRKNQLASVRE